MRATEFIRGILDLIDSVEQTQNQPHANDYEDEVAQPEEENQYANTPDEHVTSIKTILSLGNDVNSPKNPADIRADSFSMYPDWQARKK